MTARSVVAVTAGLSQPSSTRLLTDRLVAAASDDLQLGGDSVTVRVVELRDLAHQITDTMLTGFAPAELREALDAVAGADAVVAVTPVFSASYSGLFKSFFDVLEAKALAGTPVLLGATAGTERHSLVLDHALRPLFAYLGALVVPTAVFAASSDWGTASSDSLRARIERAAGELATLVRGVPRRATVDPFDDFVPFDQLQP